MIYTRCCEISRECPGSLVLIQRGDFYEAYGEHAVDVAGELDLSLTTAIPAQGGPALEMVGFPLTKAGEYIGRLVRAGHRVVIAE